MTKKHGGHGTLTYARWKSMMQRCNDPAAANFKRYGALGVTVCERWRDFPSFLTDMGACPDKSMTLDRVRNELGYEPGNCRWASKTDQNRNRTAHLMLEFGGESKVASVWAEEFGLPAKTLYSRLRNGWTIERALTTPVGKQGSWAR